MYVLKRYRNTIEILDTDDFSNDPETFEWKYNNYFRTLDDEETSATSVRYIHS